MNKNKLKKQIVALSVLLLACTAFITAACLVTNKKVQAAQSVPLSETGIDMSDQSVQLIARGGLSAVTPENTTIAVETACREGFTAVEFDIRETLDGVWVLMRERTLGRMTDGCGRIAKQTYFELLEYSVDNGANIALYPDTKIAELEDVLNVCAMYNVRPFIRVEQSSGAGLAKLAAIFSARSQTQMFAVLSADRELLQRFRELSPKTELWFDAGRLSAGQISWLEANRGVGVVVDAGKKANMDEKIEQVMNAGIKTAVWRADDAKTIEHYYTLGVNMFYTNAVLPR